MWYTLDGLLIPDDRSLDVSNSYILSHTACRYLLQSISTSKNSRYKLYCTHKRWCINITFCYSMHFLRTYNLISSLEIYDSNGPYFPWSLSLLGLLQFMMDHGSLMSFGMGDISCGLLICFMEYWVSFSWNFLNWYLSPCLLLLVPSTIPTYSTSTFNTNGVDWFATCLTIPFP